ncbi:MAG: TetR family transcriptional regulator [Thiohalomonadaceae bacterium]
MVRKTKAEAQRTRQQIIEAARNVFHEHGVARSTLEQVACRAGLTRGAVYWHFKDKAELFQAVREDVFNPMHERLDAILLGNRYSNPLDAIEAALQEIFLVLDECPTVRQMMEIMLLRCEYADEFATAQPELERPGVEFLERLEDAYGKAAAKGLLRPGADPKAMALDTWVFIGGLLHVLITRGFEARFKSQVRAMIAAHMALRRPA